jgi:asparagine synthase (glutamine-hydrolysing)
MLGNVDAALLGRMTAALEHRGPDDQGQWVDLSRAIALGQTRLAVIDLSPGGHQPMHYGHGRLTAVYNGEIYNYLEIRAVLERKGYAFTSACDTEVLLAAYDCWGVEAVHQLRGMFAFAIFNTQPDSTHPRLFLARDRFGIKPLYYSIQNNTFLFASEINALLASGLIERKMEPQAVWDYLSLGAIPPPLTIVHSVHALLPGNALCVDDHLALRHWHYWDLLENARARFSDLKKLTFADAARQLRQRLEEATRLHLVSDVPVGAFLSGGIDSSIVVGLMSQYVSEPIRTYTIGFEDQYARLDEILWARKLASRFSTRHTEVVLTGEEVAGEYDQLVQSIDQPSFDGTNTYFVSKATRQGVKVALSGLGGDELFAGYVHFASLAKAERHARRIPAFLRPAIARAANLLPQRVSNRLPGAVFDPLDRHARIRRFASETVKRRMANPSWWRQASLAPIETYYRLLVHPELDEVALVSYVEVRGYMSHTLLRDVDAMSMAHALEVRPVLLDHCLAEFAFMLPPAHKLNPSGGKRILIEATRDLIPEEILTRPKMGFGMPLFEWLCGPLAQRALTSFESDQAKTLFSSAFRKYAMRALLNHVPYDVRLWAYVMLIEWMQYEHMEL